MMKHLAFQGEAKSLGLLHLGKGRLAERAKIMEAVDRVGGEVPCTKSHCSGTRGHLVTRVGGSLTTYKRLSVIVQRAVKCWTLLSQEVVEADAIKGLRR